MKPKPKPSVLPLTTLEGTVILGSRVVPDLPYRRLTLGAALPTQIREELCKSRSPESGQRTGLAAFGHITDSHVLDAANPGRLSFLWQYFDFDSTEEFPISGLFRPQDLLTVQVLDATVRKLNTVGRGPLSQRPLDCVVMTGDLTNSFALSELTAAVGVFQGQKVTSHPVGKYEGVQDHAPAPRELSQRIWHPEPEPPSVQPDRWKASYGYPTVPGLLEAAVQPVAATGSLFPWYLGVGNHDEAGRSASDPVSAKTDFIDALRVGGRLPIQLPPRMDEEDFWDAVNESSASQRQSIIASMPSREVGASILRREFSRSDFMDSLPVNGRRNEGGSRSARENQAYYTFDISPRVIGVMLNTASPDGGGAAVMDATQADWLEKQLKLVSAKSYDPRGRLTTSRVADRLVVLFSHHPLADFAEDTMSSQVDGVSRLSRSMVLGLVSRFPNVVAWMNGHIHKHRVTPHEAKYERGGFWEITTASLIDYPQQSRIVEVIDNGDGTLSIVCTLADHSVPGSAAYDRHTPPSLAALSLELVANRPSLNHDEVSGGSEDQNVDLILEKPF